MEKKFLQKFKNWGYKGGGAVVDQALFAGAHFILNILLARWLEPEAYGAFAVAYAILLLVSNVHISLVLEPLMIFGPRKYAKNFRSYYGFILYGHWIVTIAFAVLIILFFGVRAWWVQSELTLAVLGMAIAMPCILLMWLLRKSFYLDYRTNVAAMGGAGYFLLIMLSLSALYLFYEVTSFGVFLILGFNSLLISLWFRQHFDYKINYNCKEKRKRVYIRDHWWYGKWSLPSWIMRWFPTNIYYIVLPLSMAGLGASGELKATMNLILPVIHIISALSSLILPYFVRSMTNPHNFKKRVNSVLLIFIAGCVLNLIFLITLGEYAFKILYDGQYTITIVPIILAGLYPFVYGVTSVYSAAVRSANHPDFAFWCYTTTAVTTILVGAPAAFYWGITGAFSGMLFSMTASVVIIKLYYHRMLKTEFKTA